MSMKEHVSFEGWPNCFRLFNRQIELIVTTDVGPRIISFGFVNGPNLLHVSKDDKGQTGGDSWRIYGGHRLWHSPEVMPRTYSPDNKKVNHSWNGKTLKLTQDIEPITGLIKEMEITLSPGSDQVDIVHRILNHNLWEVELAPWAITAFAGGGRIILPQEPYIDPADFLLPARPVVLWYYTHMSDPRYTWGNKYIQLVHDAAITSEQKIGILNKQGWAAYHGDGALVMIMFDFDPAARYEDYGCNNEAYVNGDFLELETLGPITRLTPGNAVEHTEHWLITAIEEHLNFENESEIDTYVSPK